MADDLPIYEALAAALAESREPDLSSFDPAQLRSAMERVLRFAGPRQNFLTWLNSRIQALSRGRVSIEYRPPMADVPEELPIRVVVAGEPFVEPAIVRADNPVVEFPMRG